MANSNVEKETMLPSFEVPEWFKHAKQGDIIEVNNEYMIYIGQMGTKSYLLHAVLETVKTQKFPSLTEQYITGYSKFRYMTFSSTTNTQERDSIQKIKIVQSDVKNVNLLNGRIIKYSDATFPVNAQESIVDRALFKYANPNTPPNFQNSQDWAFWCRFGKDIITKEIKVPSRLHMFFSSGAI